MPTEARAPRTRRSILAAAAGATGALALRAVAGPGAAVAANGDGAVLGTANTSTTVTSFENTDAGEVSLQGIAASGTAVLGTSPDGIALAGTSSAGGQGVRAQSVDGIGIETSSVNGLALHAHSTNGVGASIQGMDGAISAQSFNGTPTPDFTVPSNNTAVMALIGPTSAMSVNTDEAGVYGFSDISPNSAGVWGDSSQGVGVVGSGDWGVFGSGRIGVYAQAATSTGYGLYASGKIHFGGRAGRKAITTGHRYMDFAVTAMTPSSAVVANLQTYKSGYYIAAVVSYAGKFRLYLNKTATSNLAFSYLVMD